MNYGERAEPSVHEGFIETAPPDREVNKDFGAIHISWGTSTHVIVPLLALLCDLQVSGAGLSMGEVWNGNQWTI